MSVILLDGGTISPMVRILFTKVDIHVESSLNRSSSLSFPKVKSEETYILRSNRLVSLQIALKQLSTLLTITLSTPVQVKGEDENWIGGCAIISL
jgi:hypothetical protein